MDTYATRTIALASAVDQSESHSHVRRPEILLPNTSTPLLNHPVFTAAGELLGYMSLEEGGQLLVGRWVGDFDAEKVEAAIHVTLNMIPPGLQCRAVLTDGSGATGDWSELVPWMQYDMLPRLVELGVNLVAKVRSADPSARLAHQDYARFAARYISIRLFDDPHSARAWLRHGSRPVRPPCQDGDDLARPKSANTNDRCNARDCAKRSGPPTSVPRSSAERVVPRQGPHGIRRRVQAKLRRGEPRREMPTRRRGCHPAPPQATEAAAWWWNEKGSRTLVG